MKDLLGNGELDAIVAEAFSECRVDCSYIGSIDADAQTMLAMRCTDPGAQWCFGLGQTLVCRHVFQAVSTES